LGLQLTPTTAMRLSQQMADLYDGGLHLYSGASWCNRTGAPVVTDRLGSVRYSAGVSRSYFPYEKSGRRPGRHGEFGTYFKRRRQGRITRKQRYYNNGPEDSGCGSGRG